MLTVIEKQMNKAAEAARTWQTLCTQSYHIQTAEYQRQRENLEEAKRGKKNYLQRNKDENYIGFLFRSHEGKKIAE